MKKILFALLITSLATSCASYKRCQQKFATTVTDSIKVQVPVTFTVPRDSVVTTFVTDTVTFERIVQQGRARLTIKRTPEITSVRADCDTVTIIKTVPVKVPGPRVVFGVAPWYKKALLWMSGLATLSVFINLLLFYKRKTKTA